MNNKVIDYFRENISTSLYFLFCIMLVGAFFEIVGIGLFIPMLNESSNSGITTAIKNIFTYISFEYSNLNLAILIVIIFSIKFIILNIQNLYIYKASYEFMYQVKKTIMNGLYHMSFIEYNKLGVDTLNNIFTKEIEKSALSIRYFLQIGVNTIYSLSYLMFALYVNYVIVGIALFVGGLLVIIQRKITRAIVKYSKTVVDGNVQTNLVVLQILESMKYIKSTNGYKYNNNIFEETSKKYSDDLEKMAFLNSIPKNTPEFVGVLVISLIIIINEITLKENVVTVVFLGMLLYRVLTKLLSVQKSYQDFLINIGAINRIIEIRDLIILNKENIICSDNQIDEIKFIDIKGVIIDIDGRMILNNINMSFERGLIYSIVGQSGAGKSSLLNMITLLYPPAHGQITINGSSRLDSKSYRQKIGYVSQETVIFEGTIKENILLGNDFFFQRYNTIIESLGINDITVDWLAMGGKNISGGQRQLIALARELYKDPDILILDEFTSALDSKTEKKVISYIKSIGKDKVILIVAHRLSSVIDSDRIYLMSDGNIIDSDNFENLYMKNNEFKVMCNNQNIFLEN